MVKHYYDQNGEKIKEYQKQYYKDYYEENKQKLKEYQMQYRAKKKAQLNA